MSISNLINGQATWANLKINSASIKDDLLIPQYTVLPPPQNGLLISYDDGSGFQLWYSDGLAWAKVSGGTGSGDVSGPALATDSHIALYDGVSGKLIKNSPVEITPTSVNFFTLAPRSSNIPAVSTDLTNKSYVDNAISALSFGDCSTSLVSSNDEYIPIYDGTTGKVLNTSTVKLTGTRFQGFDALNNPAPIEFNGDTNHLGFDITNVGTIAPDSVNTNTISPKTGTSISFNNKDILDLNTVDSTNINTDFIGSATGSIVEFSDKPQSATLPSVNGDLTNKLYVDNRVGNFYAMLVDGPTVQVTGGTADPETSLLPSGVGDFDGTLTVPPNGFSVGDSFHFVVAGECIYDTSNDITLRLKNGGILASITMDLEDTDAPNTFWELEADFTIRSIGVTGSIVTNFDFTFNKKTDKDFKGQRNVTVSTINTTVSNTLDITAEFTGTDDSSMFARLGYLKKMH